MEMSGEQQVPLNREKVWEALNDPDVLAACIPGCENVEQTSETEFRVQVRASVGPVKSRFKGRVTLSELMPPESYKLSFQGDGGAGFVKGGADVKLKSQESGEGSIIAYDTRVTIGGKLAQVGSRLIDGAARKMANEFFSNLTQRLGGSYQQTGGGDAEPDKKKAGSEGDSVSRPVPAAATESAERPQSGERATTSDSMSAEPTAAHTEQKAASAEVDARSQPRSPAPPSVAPDASGKRTLWLVLAFVIVIILLAFWLY